MDDSVLGEGRRGKVSDRNVRPRSLGLIIIYTTAVITLFNGPIELLWRTVHGRWVVVTNTR